jgi:cytochrome c peroxidase
MVFREKCAKCHREPLFTDESYKSSGLQPDTLLNDPGRELITGRYSDEGRFKVPSLRNVAMTYPYMHDGRFRTLEQVVNHYSDGKFYALNTDPELQDTKNLSEVEKKEIIAFLQTLTDKDFLYDRRFADPSYR